MKNKVENEILKDNIQKIRLDKNMTKILYERNIKTLGDLCNQSKTDLRKINLQGSQIRDIEIKLQLNGLNLRNNVY